MRVSISMLKINSSDLVVILASMCLFLVFALSTVHPAIEYGAFEWTTSQFLNAVRNYLEHGPAALSFKASLMGGANQDANAYGNMPTYHIVFSYLLVKVGILEANYYSLQFITISLFAVLTAFLAKFVFDKTGSLKTALIFVFAILVNTGISYSYKDLWWEPYTLFFSYVPLFYLLSKPNARFIPLLLGAVQFLAVFDAVLFVSVSYIALSWRVDRKIHRCAYYYAVGAILGISALMLFRAIVGSSNVSGSLLLENMIAIEKSDLVRFAYYYFADPQSLLIWLYAFLTYLLTKEAYLPVTFVLASLVWTLVFPAHGMHHAYHYSTVLMIGLSLYIFTANYRSVRMRAAVGISYVLIAALISVILAGSRDVIDYAAYGEVGQHTNESSIIGMNIYSYPFSYYADREFKYVAAVSPDLEINDILVVKDFRQAEKGLHVVYSRIKAITEFLGIGVPKTVADAYHGRESRFLRQAEDLSSSLSKMGYQPVWNNRSLKAVLFKRSKQIRNVQHPVDGVQ